MGVEDEEDVEEKLKTVMGLRRKSKKDEKDSSCVIKATTSKNKREDA